MATRWELYSRETLTMEGDPAIPVIVDSWMKGLKEFDVETAYEAMRKSATTPGKDNFIRPDIDDYLGLGYIPLREEFDNSVSHALEYYIADHALSKFAAALGKESDSKRFREQSLNYTHYYCPEYGVFRPRLAKRHIPLSVQPQAGRKLRAGTRLPRGELVELLLHGATRRGGLIKMHGGKRAFVKRLQVVFDEGHYDRQMSPTSATRSSSPG